jgi:hypothetical protein
MDLDLGEPDAATGIREVEGVLQPQPVVAPQFSHL